MALTVADTTISDIIIHRYTANTVLYLVIYDYMSIWALIDLYCPISLSSVVQFKPSLCCDQTLSYVASACVTVYDTFYLIQPVYTSCFSKSYYKYIIHFIHF